MSAAGDEEAKEAKHAVNMSTNKMYNAAISTGEIADELGISVEEAYERLDRSFTRSGHLNKKHVAKTDESDPRNYIWW